MKKLPVILLALLALASCRKDETPGESRLVVEGWIENGGHPVVMLSESIGITTGQQMSVRDFMDHMARWAKVTVSDGENSVVLTGVPDPEYFPPYVFTTDRIVGEVGKSYSLKVEYKDYVATATTVIPVPVPLDTDSPLRPGWPMPQRKTVICIIWSIRFLGTVSATKVLSGKRPCFPITFA